jgi:hypothetical protein
MQEDSQQFYKSKKFILAISGVVILCITGIFIVILSNKNQRVLPNTPQPGTNSTNPVQNNASTARTNKASTGNTFNIFSWLFPSKSSSNQSGQSVNTQTSSSTQLQETSVPTPKPTSFVSQLGQNANSNNTNGNTSNSTNNNSGGTNSNVTNFQIVFQGPDGPQTYVPPTTPPVQVTWTRYIDPIDHYSLDYPANWQLKQQNTNGHTGFSLYLPGANIQDPNQQYAGFGWSNFNLYPANDPNSQSYATAATITGVTGSLYTYGAEGKSYIIGIFPYREGYFGIGSTASDPTFAYIYQHMLQSLVFANY